MHDKSGPGGLRFLRPLIIHFLAAALVFTSGQAVAGAQLVFGTLPVLQALPLFVAEEQGFFRKQGLEVALVGFNSAMEKDVALAAGSIQGYFGDLPTSITARGGGNDFRLVATIFNTAADRRMFGIVAAPGSNLKTLGEAAAAGIGASANTINEYLIARLLDVGRAVTMVETKNIPIRLQMLISGQLQAALLPEPLLTLAEVQGGRVLADDAGKGLSATVLGFSAAVLRDRAAEVGKFLAAVDEAARWINAHPVEARPIMIRACRIPEPLQAKFSVPRYPPLATPDAGQVMDVYRWLQEKGVVRVELSRAQMVADGFIP